MHPIHPIFSGGFAVLLSVSALALDIQDPAVRTKDNPAGSWQGVLDAGVELKVALHLKRADDGTWTGTFDSLTQSALGIPLTSVTYDDGALELELNSIGATFSGTWGDGSPPTLQGIWKQGPAKLPLTLRAVDEVEMKPLVRPQHPKPPFPYKVESVALSYDPNNLWDSFHPGAADGDATGAITLSGTLTLPQGDGPFPAALLITGSGPQDRDESLMGHKPFLVIAHHLTQQGLAVLRLDDRGTGQSTGTFDGSTTADFALDARAALRFLYSRKDIDQGRTGLIGHSEGGIIAPIVAASDDGEMVNFAVLIAPPAVNIADIVMHQQQLIGAAAGESEEDLATTQTFMATVFAAMRKGADDEEMDATIRKAAEAVWENLSEEDMETLGSVETLVEQGQSMGDPWMRYLVTVEPSDPLSQMKCPTLALFGGKDLQVDPAQNEGPLREAFAAGGLVEPKVIVLADHNHLFQRCKTGAPSEYQSIEETFSPAALDAMAEWLRDTIIKRQ